MTVKPLIDEMAGAGRGAKAIATVFQVIRAVVAFAKDEKTRKPLYPGMPPVSPPSPCGK